MTKKIKKTKNTKKIKKPIKTALVKSAKSFPVKTKNTPGYYLCMGETCQGKNITKAAHDRKTTALSVIAHRTKKLKELQKAAKIVGRFANDLERVLQR